MCIERERKSENLKQALTEVITAQEDLINVQQEAMMHLLHENTEQENMINVMMREHTE